MSFFGRIKSGGKLYLLSFLIVAIITMLAYMSLQHFVRIDLTDAKKYTLSTGSKNIVKNLDDILTVKVFFSSELPPNLLSVRQHVEDLLSELFSISGGKLNVLFLDPSNEDVKKEALMLGIPAVRMNILEKDRFEVKNGFLGIALMYGDQHEILPIVKNLNNIEYDFSSAIKKLVTPNLNRVAFISGHGEYLVEDAGLLVNKRNSYFDFKKSLEKNYSVLTVNLSDDLTDIDTIIIGGPKEAFSNNDRYAIDQFILKGKNVVFLVDGVFVNSVLEAEPLNLVLDDFLGYYGASVDHSLALDTSNEVASFIQDDSSFIVPYPLWVKAIADNFDSSTPILSKLNSILFQWASPIYINPSADTKITKLILTTDDAWVQEKSFDLSPDVHSRRIDKKGGQVLSVLISDIKDSYFSSNRMYSRQDDFIKTTKSSGRILLIGNSRFITDHVLTEYPQNLKFVMNAIDYITLDESLIGIRSRVDYDRSLIRLTGSEKQTIRLFGIFLMPSLMILYGLIRFIKRKYKKTSF